MFKVEYEGEIWEYAFAQTDSALSEEGREDLVRETIRVYKKRARSDNIRGAGFEGRLKKDKVYTLGSFGGQLYLGEIETNRGKRNIGLLVSRLIDASLN